MTTKLHRRLFDIVVISGFGVALAAATAANAQGAGNLGTRQTCSIPMTPTDADTLLKIFQDNPRLRREANQNTGIVLGTMVDTRTSTELSADGFLMSEFEFKRNGQFGMLRTSGDLAAVSMRYALAYDPEQQMLTATLQGDPLTFEIFVEATGVIEGDTTVTTSAMDSIGLERDQADMGTPPSGGQAGAAAPPQASAQGLNFGMNIAESRGQGRRRLRATAFGLPAHIEPVVDCSGPTILLGVRLVMNYSLQLDVKVIDRVDIEIENRELTISLVDRLLGTRSSGSSRRAFRTQALKGTATVAASGKGLFTGVIVDPKVVRNGRRLPFFREAFLQFRFDVNETPIAVARGGSASETL